MKLRLEDSEMFLPIFLYIPLPLGFGLNELTPKRILCNAQMEFLTFMGLYYQVKYGVIYAL